MSQTIKLDNSLPVYSRYKAQKIIIGKYIAYLILYLEIFFLLSSHDMVVGDEG